MKNQSRLLDDEVKELVDRLRHLERERYKTLVLCGPPLTGKTKLAMAVCETYGAHYVDVTSEVLPMTKSPTLGVYGADEFRSWIKSRMKSLRSSLCVDEVEPLLATFPERHLLSLFGMMQRLENPYPLLFVTRFENVLHRSNFPSERVHYVTR
ncbi:AAA family ATPase [Candidatus Poribacteria bacterium]